MYYVRIYLLKPEIIIMNVYMKTIVLGEVMNYKDSKPTI